MKLTGIAILYNSPSESIHNQFTERLCPGCFDAHLDSKPDIVATIDHDFQKLLGRTSSGTLKLHRDLEGIAVEVAESDISYARDLEQSIKRGDIRGMSFIFDVVRDHWPSRGEREVEEAKLYEVSFVAFPAYPATSTGLRHNQRERMRLRLAAAELDRCERLVWRRNGKVTEVSGDEAEMIRVRMLYAKGLVGTRAKRVYRAEVRAS